MKTHGIPLASLQLCAWLYVRRRELACGMYAGAPIVAYSRQIADRSSQESAPC